MGLYSTIQKPALSLEESAEIDRLLDNPSNTEQFGHLMEFVVMVHENDKQLFDSLIECDFISATNSMVLTEEENSNVEGKSNKVKSGKIGDKIKMVLVKLKEFLIKAGQSFIAKVVDLTKADKKIYDTYKDVLTKSENMIGFGGLKQFAYPAAISGNSLMTDFNNAASKFAHSVEKANSRDSVDDAISTFKESIEKYTNQVNAEIGFGFENKVDSFIPSSQQIAESLGVINNAKKIIDGIKSLTKQCVGQVKNLEVYAKAILKSKEEMSEIETYKGTKLSEMISGSAKALSATFSAYTRTATRQIAAYRKLVIICGRYAAKKAKEKDPNTLSRVTGPVANEAAIEWILGESSDEFVIEHFAY